MKTEIVFLTLEGSLLVKETYQTVKRRLLSEGLFFEVTAVEGKMTIAKSAVGVCTKYEEKTEKKKGKHDKI